MGHSSYPPPPGTYDEYIPKYMTYKTILRYLNCYCIGPTQDTFEANFEDWSRLFSTPNPQADITFQIPVPTGRPGRDVGPPERHTYSTDHVHAQRKRGRHGRGGRGG